MKDKFELMKTGCCCYTCTTPGHTSKTCKSTNTCQAKGAEGKVCGSKSHHTLLHRDVTPGGTKQPAKGKSDAYSTGSTPATGGEVPPTPVPEPVGGTDIGGPQKEGAEITEVNSIRTFSASLAECYLADKMEGQDQVRLTNVGTVLIKGGSTGDRHVITMFDLCSSDNWCSQATLRNI